jgi:peptide/nickel transport system permease protein
MTTVADATNSPPDEGDRQLLLGAEPVARTQWQLFRRRFFRHKLAMFGLFILVVLMVCCFGARWIAPYANKPDLLAEAAGPSRKHLMGVDLVGKDFLTANLYAGQISLKIGIFVSIISTLVGTMTGAVAGYLGSASDQILMRVTDLFLLLPALAVLAIALQKFGQSELAIILVLAGLGWMGIARIVRGLVLSLKEKEFVEAAKAIGCSRRRIVIRHIVPNLVGPIMVNASLAVAGAIIAESTLSFLGLGFPPDIPTWGRVLYDAKDYLDIAPYWALFPGTLIFLTVLSINYLGDGLRDALDPRRIL